MVVAAASAMVCRFSSIKRFSARRFGSSGSPGFLLLFILFTSLLVDLVGAISNDLLTAQQV